MTEIPKKELGKMIDALIDSSVQLHHIEIKVKSITNQIDGLSTKLFFHYQDDDQKED